MTEITAKEAYTALSENLPDFDTLNIFFQLTIQEPQKLTLNDVIKPIIEAIDEHAAFLESLLQPDTSLINMVEANACTQADKDNILKTLQKIMIIIREHDLTQLQNKPKDLFLKKLCDDWSSIKDDLTKIYEKAQSAWQSESKTTKQEKYFG